MSKVSHCPGPDCSGLIAVELVVWLPGLVAEVRVLLS